MFRRVEFEKTPAEVGLSLLKIWWVTIENNHCDHITTWPICCDLTTADSRDIGPRNRFDIDKIYTFTGPILIAPRPKIRKIGGFSTKQWISVLPKWIRNTFPEFGHHQHAKRLPMGSEISPSTVPPNFEAVNPFKSIPGIYDEEILKSFISTAKSTKPGISDCLCGCQVCVFRFW